MKDLSDISDFSDLPEELARRRVLTTRRAAAFVGRSVVHWRRLHLEGKTPKPIRLGVRAMGWRIGDLVDWMDQKMREAA
jgi:prophage regulatory protein